MKSSTIFAKFTCPGILNNSSVNLSSNRVCRALGSNTALKKSRVRLFLSTKMVKNDPSKRPERVNFGLENLYFWDHLSTYRAENTTKSRPFMAENTAQTLPKQL